MTKYELEKAMTKYYDSHDCTTILGKGYEPMCVSIALVVVFAVLLISGYQLIVT